MTCWAGVIKVTPSSKMVGDFAIFMVQNKLDRNNILERGKELTFPRSVVDYFKGMMGQSTFPLPQELSEVVLKGEKPLDTLPSKLLPRQTLMPLWKSCGRSIPRRDCARPLPTACIPRW